MKRILIVNDEKLIRYSLSAALKGKDVEVLGVQDGQQALKAFRTQTFDFCFLDMQLPGMNGIDILKAVRLLAPRTKIIMMTGSEIDQAGMRVIRRQAYLFLTKPFDLFRVKRIIDAVSEKDENTFQELRELEARLAVERRRNSREAVIKPVTYSTSGSGEQQQYTADLLDISDTGTCIRTACHLQPGSKVQFRTL